MFKIKDAWQIVENTQGIQIYTDTRDGQQYRYKQFGTQIWMIDNWNYGGLPGDYVQINQSASLGHAYRYGGVDDYQNWESEYGMKRGALYSADHSSYWGVPSGWHVATKSDWDTLISWANTEFPGFGVQALMAKTTFWCPNNPSSSVVYDNYNKSGFDLVPAGHASTMNRNYGGSDKSTNCIACFYTRTSSGYREFYTFTQNENSTPTASERSWDTGTWFVSSIRLVKDGGLPPAQPIITDIVTSLDSTGSDNKIATEKATRSAITSAVSSKMSNPMTTAGDIIVGGTSGAPSRLGVGSSGQVLKIGANGIEWGAETGQALYLGAFDSRNRPQNATTGQFILDTDLGYIIYRYGSAWINPTGTVLEGNVTPSGNDPVQWLANPMSASGDLIVGGSSGSPSRLAKGTDGQVLTLNSGTPTWSDNTGDHKVSVDGTDTAAYLEDKLVAGSNVTLTKSGGQIEIAAAGGGGGGGSGTLRQTIFRPYLLKTRSVSISYGWIFYVVPETEYIDGFETIFSSDKTTIPTPFDCAIFEGNIRQTATKISGASTKYFRSSMNYFRVFGGTFNTPVHIDPTKGHWVYLLTGPFGSAYFAEQIYGTVTNSSDTIGSTSNVASIPNTLGTINDSDGIMPAFTLIGHN